jgi:type I restriction enzyme S subunit
MREDWQLIRLDEYLDIQGGSQPPKSNFIYEPKKGYIQLLQIRDFGQKPVPTYVPINMVTKFCEENDVLIARYGASLGRIVTGLKGAYNVALAKVIDNQELFIKKYLFYLLQTSVLQKPLKLISRTAQNGFAKHEIGHIQLPLCSILEQKAIVAKIEQLFSELDNGIANLKTAQAKLKIYRQAVLKKAFEGELTKEWREKQTNLPTADELLEQIKKEREEHYKQQLEEWKQALNEWEENGKNGKKPSKPTKLKDINSVDDKNLLNIPNNWLYILTENISDFITKGTTPTKTELFSGKGDIPFLKVYNLTFNTSLDFDNNPTYVNKETHENFLKRSIVYPNDVLMNIVGPPLGKVSIVPDIFPEWNMNQAMVRFRPYKILTSKYLAYYLLAHETIQRISKKAKATVGQFNLTLEICREIEIPICSLSEQNKIIEEIESRLSVCDKIEETIETSLAKSEALRQSILKKAFEGKLLSEQELENIKNHPEYESAEELLKRIKKERSK